MDSIKKGISTGELFAQIAVVYEDDYLLVINKPVGLVVTPGAGFAEDKTLIAWLISRYGDDYRKIGVNPSRPGIVHRLDKDTSGVMLIAKNNPAFNNLVEQFKTRQIKKEYKTVAWSDLTASLLARGYTTKSFEIDAPVGRNPRWRTKFIVLTSGKPARTKFVIEKVTLVSETLDLKLTALTALPITGRTHQIRVHLKSMGVSVVGDRLYQSRAELAQKEQLLTENKICDRMYLHAQKITLKLPSTGEEKTFESALPECFIPFFPSQG